MELLAQGVFSQRAPAGPGQTGVHSGGELAVSWKNDKGHLYLALNGSTDAWLSIGFDPLEWMKNADIILASVQGGKAVVLDEYCTGNYGPHIEDTMLGGSDGVSWKQEAANRRAGP